MSMSEGKETAARKSYSFAVKIVKVMRKVMKEQNEYDITRQLLRSGTAVGSMLSEAHYAETQKDFIHKLSLARKEANEARYWISLLRDSEILRPDIASDLFQDAEHLVKMLTSSIKTIKTKTLGKEASETLQ